MGWKKREEREGEEIGAIGKRRKLGALVKSLAKQIYSLIRK